MIQIDIDRYNKGQNEYTMKLLPSVVKPHFEIFQDGEPVELLILEELILSESWREMFDKDPDYQKEFWEWMIKNGDAVEKKRESGILCLEMPCYYIYDYDGDSVLPTRKILTGFIIEFMQERMK